jgi:hypothetical protein
MINSAGDFSDVDDIGDVCVMSVWLCFRAISLTY